MVRKLSISVECDIFHSPVVAFSTWCRFPSPQPSQLLWCMFCEMVHCQLVRKVTAVHRTDVPEVVRFTGLFMEVPPPTTRAVKRRHTVIRRQSCHTLSTLSTSSYAVANAVIGRNKGCQTPSYAFVNTVIRCHTLPAAPAAYDGSGCGGIFMGIDVISRKERKSP